MDIQENGRKEKDRLQSTQYAPILFTLRQIQRAKFLVFFILKLDLKGSNIPDPAAV